VSEQRCEDRITYPGQFRSVPCTYPAKFYVLIPRPHGEVVRAALRCGVHVRHARTIPGAIVSSPSDQPS
jgi:hypothetical protein